MSNQKDDLGLKISTIIDAPNKATNVIMLPEDRFAELRYLREMPSDNHAFAVKEFDVGVIENGRVLGDIFVYTENNEFIPQLSSRRKADLGELDVYLKRCNGQLPAPEKINGRVLNVMDSMEYNYFHFLIYNLSTLPLTIHKEFDYVNFPMNQKFHVDYFQLLGFKPNQLLKCKSVFWESSELITSSKGIYNNGLDWLQKEIMAKIEPDKSPNEYEKIYLSRNDSKNQRRLLNEKEFIDNLNKHGFKEVILGQLSVKEQIRLIAKARFVVSIHGAALANMIYLNKGARVIEITHKDYLHSVPFRAGNRNNNMVWGVLLAEKDLSGFDLSNNPSDQTINCSANLKVDIDKFNRLYECINQINPEL